MKENSQRIAHNAIFLYFRMLVVLFVNLFTARVLLKALGVEDYGVYNVVAGFVSLFGFLNATLSSSVQRFYNYEGSKHGKEGFQKIYITAVFIHIFIACLTFVLLETFGLWYVNNVMVVANSRIFAANYLFQTSILSLILIMLQIPYTGAIMAKERMDYFAIISIIDVLFRLIVAIIVDYSSHDKLVLYGSLLCSISIFNISAYYIYCKKNIHEIKFRLFFDKKSFKAMLSFSGWNLIGTFAFLLKGQGVNMLLNYFFGPVINAARGIAYQINGAIGSFSGNIYTVFGPQLVSSYAQTDYERTKKIMFTESKVSFSLIALLVMPAIFEMDTLLTIWLGNSVPEHTKIFAILVLLDTLVCTLNTPCTQVVQATGKIKKYQIGTTIINLFLVPFCWILLALGYSAESTFMSVVFFSCMNQCICLYLTNKEFQIDLRTYFGEIIVRCLVLLLLLPVIPLIISLTMPPSIIRLVILSISSILTGGLLIYYCMFDLNDRNFILSFVRKKLKK